MLRDANRRADRQPHGVVKQVMDEQVGRYFWERWERRREEKAALLGRQCRPGMRHPIGRTAAPDRYRCSIAVVGVSQKKMSLQVALDCIHILWCSPSWKCTRTPWRRINAYAHHFTIWCIRYTGIILTTSHTMWVWNSYGPCNLDEGSEPVTQASSGARYDWKVGLISACGPTQQVVTKSGWHNVNSQEHRFMHVDILCVI
jgi:hypothetical protein